MLPNTKNIMEKAETRFLETQKKIAERNKAMTEYQSEAKARATKTARLRAMRLAEEETERAAAVLAPKPDKKKRAPRAAKKAAEPATLASKES